MKYLGVIMMCVILFSCLQENKTKEKGAEEERNIKKQLTTEEIVKQYIPAANHLEFDEITHYHNKDLEEDQILGGDELLAVTNDEKLLNEFGFNRNIELGDSTKIKDLTRIGYTKYIVATLYLPIIKALIHPQTNEYFAEETVCTHVYRDILVFKHQNKTVAIIKWCFSCGDIVITRIAGKDINLEVYSGQLATIFGKNYKSQTNESLFKIYK